MAFLNQYGSYTLPPTIYCSELPQNYNVPRAKLPRQDGARVLPSMLEEKKIQCEGGLIRTLASTLESQLDALKTALAVKNAKFRIRDDRYWRNCQIEDFTFRFDPTWMGRITDLRFSVVTGDPFSYEDAVNTQTHLLSGYGDPNDFTQADTIAGDAYAAPQFKFTVSSTGSLALIFTNQTTSEVFTLSGTVTNGDVIIVDSIAETVTIADVDKMTLFDGQFPRMNVGANTVRVQGGGARLSQYQLVWQNRWL